MRYYVMYKGDTSFEVLETENPLINESKNYETKQEAIDEIIRLLECNIKGFTKWTNESKKELKKWKEK